ncbi:MAG: hypothetical protein LUH02_11365 [Erysipelotrichaceae bacterium]|nr:hypothetical protein [Erysipelotrichaceae bacterium]
MPERKGVTMHYQSVMGTATIEFIEENQKQQVIEDIFLNRYPSTRHIDYNKTSPPMTMIAKLTVNTITAKMNPMPGNVD